MVSACSLNSLEYRDISVAHRVRISSIVLLRSLDCAGGTGPVVEVGAPDVPGTANGAVELPVVGAAVLVVVAGCEAGAVAAPPNENGLAAGAEVVEGWEADEVVGGPKENGLAAAVVAAVPAADEAAEVVDPPSPPKRGF